jgi:hypothetical protein
MNNDRRKKLTQAVTFLENARNLIDEMKGEEEESYEGLPENMQGGERGEKLQAAIEALSEASDSIEQAIDHISTATE